MMRKSVTGGFFGADPALGSVGLVSGDEASRTFARIEAHASAGTAFAEDWETVGDWDADGGWQTGQGGMVHRGRPGGQRGRPGGHGPIHPAVQQMMRQHQAMMSHPMMRGMLGNVPQPHGGVPPWMQPKVAPGVHQPGEGMIPLPLNPSNGTGLFGLGTGIITFTGTPQMPFRGERIEAIVIRTGASAAPIIPVFTAMFVGTRLQQAQFGNVAVENYGPTAFGVRNYMVDALPGILFNFPVALTGGALVGTDTIQVIITVHGRSLA